MITKILTELINTVIKDIKVIESNRPELCDYQIDSAFKMAKELKRSPFEIGNEWVEKIKTIDNYSYYFKNVECVSGFVNLTLSDDFINDRVKSMNNSDKFGIESDSKTCVIDYGGPNVAKPLHVGHLRSAIIGEAIKRILEYKGNNVISDVHLGDYGLQIGQVIYAILNDGIKDEDITLEYLNEAYPRMSALCKENEEIKIKCENITKEMQDGNSEYNRLQEIIFDISVKDIKDIYNILSVSFNYWYGEKEAYKYIPELTKIFENKQLLEKSEGAVIVDVKEESDSKELPPLIYQKSNGAYLYSTTDLATIYQREKDFKPEEIIYITDDRQSMHFKQVFRATKRADLTKAELVHLGYGTVNGTDGKPFKTRAGNAPSLRELLDEVKEIFITKKEENKDMPSDDITKIVNSIVKFADLQNNMSNDYVFDINKFSNTSGKTGPYMQYTVLRIRKIIEGNEIKEMTNNIYNDVDRKLRLKLISLEDSFNKAYSFKKVNYLIDYIYDLAECVNNFYQNNHVSSLADDVNKNDWLYILNITNRVLTDMLYLVSIEIPSYM